MLSPILSLSLPLDALQARQDGLGDFAMCPASIIHDQSTPIALQRCSTPSRCKNRSINWSICLLIFSSVWTPVHFFLSIEWITSKAEGLLFHWCSHYYILLLLYYSFKLGCVFGALFCILVIQPANVGKVIFSEWRIGCICLFFWFYCNIIIPCVSYFSNTRRTGKVCHTLGIMHPLLHITSWFTFPPEGSRTTLLRCNNSSELHCLQLNHPNFLYHIMFKAGRVLVIVVRGDVERSRLSPN